VNASLPKRWWRGNEGDGLALQLAAAIPHNPG
jgi:hypothetical protein